MQGRDAQSGGCQGCGFPTVVSPGNTVIGFKQGGLPTPVPDADPPPRVTTVWQAQMNRSRASHALLERVRT